MTQRSSHIFLVTLLLQFVKVPTNHLLGIPLVRHRAQARVDLDHNSINQLFMPKHIILLMQARAIHGFIFSSSDYEITDELVHQLLVLLPRQGIQAVGVAIAF